MGDKRNAYKILEKLKGRELGRHGHSWEDNGRMVLGEIWWKVVDWIYLA
jgi:hypothetical protein